LDFAKLRFIRSASAPLPPAVMEQMELTFNSPVIESYGMTEATHQIASNPLPPRVRKAGSVGIPVGTELAVIDDRGNLLPTSQAGEVVIRGPNVTRGYESNPAANTRAFQAGWFRTGDQGVLDADGYLRLTGRLKELINRGGEKISPLEVDEVLLSHPAIAQAVTFAIPHPKLGEEVGAAVVLREGQGLSDRELKDFAGHHLPDFKIPRKILFLAEIPKGATGKVVRIGLAAKLGLGEPSQ
jgi:oxalate---CoA ligase